MDGPATPTPEREDGGGFGSGMTAGAVLATIFAPFVSLVVALMWHGNERNESRRAFLRTWAWISGGLIVLYFLIGMVIFASFSRGGLPDRNDSGPCMGGPIIGEPAEHIEGDRYRVRCVFGGSEIIRLPPP